MMLPCLQMYALLARYQLASKSGLDYTYIVCVCVHQSGGANIVDIKNYDRFAQVTISIKFNYF